MTVSNLHRYFHPAGWPFIGIFAFVTFLTMFVGGATFVAASILLVWCFYFFRDPQRVTPVRPGLVVSPADGRVVAVKEVVPEAVLGLGDEPRTRISIFLNVFNVHVNRMPVDGIVRGRYYRPGKFVNAALDKASEENERMALVVEMTGTHPADNKTLGVVQIAGLIARRIICNAQEGSTYKAGQRFGIIRFGSRTDVYLPAGVKSLVAVGQTMIGAETILADCALVQTDLNHEVRQ